MKAALRTVDLYVVRFPSFVLRSHTKCTRGKEILLSKLLFYYYEKYVHIAMHCAKL